MTSRTSGPPLVGLLGVSVLPVVLSMIAGSVDVIGLYALDTFTSHITRNLVLLAARVVGGEHARIGQLLSVPVFVVVLVLTKLLADRLESFGLAPLRSLLLLQFMYRPAYGGGTAAASRVGRSPRRTPA
jgi:uncharacterized membrane protein YoaK (UPF0700 family)